MIPDTILGLVFYGIAALIGLIPSFSLPGWLGIGGTVVAQAGSLGTDAAGLGAWVPLSTLATVIEAILVSIPIAVGIVLVRMLISNITGGGGAT